MNKLVKAKISRADDGTYSVYNEENPSLFGMGDTIPKAKEEFLETVKLTKSIGKELAQIYPDWMDEDYEFEYKFDVSDFLEFYSGIITPTALGRLSGINPKQIWSYMHGVSKPRRAQVIKIEEALHKLGEELTHISF